MAYQINSSSNTNAIANYFKDVHSLYNVFNNTGNFATMDEHSAFRHNVVVYTNNNKMVAFYLNDEENDQLVIDVMDTAMMESIARQTYATMDLDSNQAAKAIEFAVKLIIN